MVTRTVFWENTSDCVWVLVASKMSTKFSIVASTTGLIITSFLKKRGGKIQNISYVIQISVRRKKTRPLLSNYVSEWKLATWARPRGRWGKVVEKVGRRMDLFEGCFFFFWEGCIHSHSGAGRSFKDNDFSGECSYRTGRGKDGKRSPLWVCLLGSAHRPGAYSTNYFLVQDSLRITITLPMWQNGLRELNIIKNPHWQVAELEFKTCSY